jgi:hypothetical protein
MSSRLGKIVLAALFLAVFSLPASAQVYTGRIDVTAVDSTGAVLPGVTMEIGGVQKAVQVTDARGEAHFLNLAPGNYTVMGTLTGFNNYKNDSVQVGAGTSTELKATMSVGGVTATETVKAETPMLNTRKETVSTSVGLDELQKIPSSRDPWVVLQTVPGVIVDRVNVGGAESGQQSNYQAKGASGADNTWNMDGIAITDMAATGSTPTYYDFDMFSEMQVTTGGADVSTATPGIALNLVLRSGTNTIKGSGRYYWEGEDTQSNNVTGGDIKGILGSYNRMKEYTDFGGEAGGPIVKNRLFVWGAYGKTHPQLQIFTKDPKVVGNYLQTAKDETLLENYSGKATAEINNKTRGSFTYFRGNKEKHGRGASGTRPDETTVDQTGPSQLFKGEVNLTATNSLYVTARYAHFTNGFSLTPRSGNTTKQAFLDLTDGTWHNNFYFYSTDRPQNTASLDGNFFKGNHEFKFGFSYRKVNVTSSTTWAGGAIYIGFGGDDYEAELLRDHHPNGSAKYYTGYVQDTFTKDRLTANVGLRWDNQRGSLGVIDDPASAMVPNLLPHLTGTAAKDAIVWNSIAPRIGITYALDESRRTLARASYSRFASQLSSGAATILSTVQYSYVYFYGVDANHDRQVQPGELIGNLNTGEGNAGYVGFNIANPSSLTTPNKIGDYKTPMTDEFIIGADRQLTRDISLSGTWTYRKYTNFVWNPLTGVDGNDYSVAGAVSATSSLVGPYSVNYYKINPAAIPGDSGHTYSTRPDYSRNFKGLEFAATKRMSNNWFARMAWSTNRSREFFKSPAAMGDPTPGPASPNIDGGLVVTQSGGSGKSSIYMVLPKQQFIFNMGYQAKWGINTGINYVFHTGYSQPYYLSKVPTGDALLASKSVLAVGGVDWYTLPSVHSLDARLGKEFKFNRTSINIDVDAFNVLNVGTVLGKQYDLNAKTAGQVLEIINPRILRFGVRIGF